MIIVSAAEMRQLDNMVQRLGVSALILMENAGRALRTIVRDGWPIDPGHLKMGHQPRDKQLSAMPCNRSPCREIQREKIPVRKHGKRQEHWNLAGQAERRGRLALPAFGC